MRENKKNGKNLIYESKSPAIHKQVDRVSVDTPLDVDAVATGVASKKQRVSFASYVGIGRKSHVYTNRDDERKRTIGKIVLGIVIAILIALLIFPLAICSPAIKQEEPIIHEKISIFKTVQTEYTLPGDYVLTEEDDAVIGLGNNALGLTFPCTLNLGGYTLDLNGRTFSMTATEGAIALKNGNIKNGKFYIYSDDGSVLLDTIVFGDDVDYRLNTANTAVTISHAVESAIKAESLNLNGGTLMLSGSTISGGLNINYNCIISANSNVESINVKKDNVAIQANDSNIGSIKLSNSATLFGDIDCDVEVTRKATLTVGEGANLNNVTMSSPKTGLQQSSDSSIKNLVVEDADSIGIAGKIENLTVNIVRETDDKTALTLFAVKDSEFGTLTINGTNSINADLRGEGGTITVNNPNTDLTVGKHQNDPNHTGAHIKELYFGEEVAGDFILENCARVDNLVNNSDGVTSNLKGEVGTLELNGSSDVVVERCSIIGDMNINSGAKVEVNGTISTLNIIGDAIVNTSATSYLKQTNIDENSYASLNIDGKAAVINDNSPDAQIKIKYDAEVGLVSIKDEASKENIINNSAKKDETSIKLEEDIEEGEKEIYESTFIMPVLYIDSDCMEQGIIVKTPGGVEHTERNRIVDKLTTKDHDYRYRVIVAAGPGTEGIGEYYCVDCDESYRVVIPARSVVVDVQTVVDLFGLMLEPAEYDFALDDNTGFVFDNDQMYNISTRIGDVGEAMTLLILNTGYIHVTIEDAAVYGDIQLKVAYLTNRSAIPANYGDIKAENKDDHVYTFQLVFTGSKAYINFLDNDEQITELADIQEALDDLLEPLGFDSHSIVATVNTIRRLKDLANTYKKYLDEMSDRMKDRIEEAIEDFKIGDNIPVFHETVDEEGHTIYELDWNLIADGLEEYGDKTIATILDFSYGEGFTAQIFDYLKGVPNLTVNKIVDDILFISNNYDLNKDQLFSDVSFIIATIAEQFDVDTATIIEIFGDPIDIRNTIDVYGNKTIYELIFGLEPDDFDEYVKFVQKKANFDNSWAELIADVSKVTDITLASVVDSGYALIRNIWPDFKESTGCLYKVAEQVRTLEDLVGFTYKTNRDEEFVYAYAEVTYDQYDVSAIVDLENNYQVVTYKDNENAGKVEHGDELYSIDVAVKDYRVVLRHDHDDAQILIDIDNYDINYNKNNKYTSASVAIEDYVNGSFLKDANGYTARLTAKATVDSRPYEAAITTSCTYATEEGEKNEIHSSFTLDGNEATCIVTNEVDRYSISIPDIDVFMEVFMAENETTAKLTHRDHYLVLYEGETIHKVRMDMGNEHAEVYFSKELGYGMDIVFHGAVCSLEALQNITLSLSANEKEGGFVKFNYKGATTEEDIDVFASVNLVTREASVKYEDEHLMVALNGSHENGVNATVTYDDYSATASFDKDQVFTAYIINGKNDYIDLSFNLDKGGHAYVKVLDYTFGVTHDLVTGAQAASIDHGDYRFHYTYNAETGYTLDGNVLGYEVSLTHTPENVFGVSFRYKSNMAAVTYSLNGAFTLKLEFEYLEHIYGGDFAIGFDEDVNPIKLAVGIASYELNGDIQFKGGFDWTNVVSENANESGESLTVYYGYDEYKEDIKYSYMNTASTKTLFTEKTTALEEKEKELSHLEFAVLRKNFYTTIHGLEVAFDFASPEVGAEQTDCKVSATAIYELRKYVFNGGYALNGEEKLPKAVNGDFTYYYDGRVDTGVELDWNYVEKETGMVQSAAIDLSVVAKEDDYSFDASIALDETASGDVYPSALSISYAQTYDKAKTSFDMDWTASIKDTKTFALNGNFTNANKSYDVRGALSYDDSNLYELGLGYEYTEDAKRLIDINFDWNYDAEGNYSLKANYELPEHNYAFDGALTMVDDAVASVDLSYIQVVEEVTEYDINASWKYAEATNDYRIALNYTDVNVGYIIEAAYGMADGEKLPHTIYAKYQNSKDQKAENDVLLNWQYDAATDAYSLVASFVDAKYDFCLDGAYAFHEDEVLPATVSAGIVFKDLNKTLFDVSVDWEYVESEKKYTFDLAYDDNTDRVSFNGEVVLSEDAVPYVAYAKYVNYYLEELKTTIIIDWKYNKETDTYSFKLNYNDGTDNVNFNAAMVLDEEAIVPEAILAEYANYYEGEQKVAIKAVWDTIERIDDTTKYEGELTYTDGTYKHVLTANAIFADGEKAPKTSDVKYVGYDKDGVMKSATLESTYSEETGAYDFVISYKHNDDNPIYSFGFVIDPEDGSFAGLSLGYKYYNAKEFVIDVHGSWLRTKEDGVTANTYKGYYEFNKEIYDLQVGYGIDEEGSIVLLDNYAYYYVNDYTTPHNAGVIFWNKAEGTYKFTGIYKEHLVFNASYDGEIYDYRVDAHNHKFVLSNTTGFELSAVVSAGMDKYEEGTTEYNEYEFRIQNYMDQYFWARLHDPMGTVDISFAWEFKKALPRYEFETIHDLAYLIKDYGYSWSKIIDSFKKYTAVFDINYEVPSGEFFYMTWDPSVSQIDVHYYLTLALSEEDSDKLADDFFEYEAAAFVYAFRKVFLPIKFAGETFNDVLEDFRLEPLSGEGDLRKGYVKLDVLNSNKSTIYEYHTSEDGRVADRLTNTYYLVDDGEVLDGEEVIGYNYKIVEATTTLAVEDRRNIDITIIDGLRVTFSSYLGRKDVAIRNPDINSGELRFDNETKELTYTHNAYLHDVDAYTHYVEYNIQKFGFDFDDYIASWAWGYADRESFVMDGVMIRVQVQAIVNKDDVIYGMVGKYEMPNNRDKEYVVYVDGIRETRLYSSEDFYINIECGFNVYQERKTDLFVKVEGFEDNGKDPESPEYRESGYFVDAIVTSDFNNNIYTGKYDMLRKGYRACNDGKLDENHAYFSINVKDLIFKAGYNRIDYADSVEGIVESLDVNALVDVNKNIVKGTAKYIDYCESSDKVGDMYVNKNYYLDYTLDLEVSYDIVREIATGTFDWNNYYSGGELEADVDGGFEFNIREEKQISMGFEYHNYGTSYKYKPEGELVLFDTMSASILVDHDTQKLTITYYWNDLRDLDDPYRYCDASFVIDVNARTITGAVEFYDYSYTNTNIAKEYYLDREIWASVDINHDTGIMKYTLKKNDYYSDGKLNYTYEGALIIDCINNKTFDFDFVLNNYEGVSKENIHYLGDITTIDLTIDHETQTIVGSYKVISYSATDFVDGYLNIEFCVDVPAHKFTASVHECDYDNSAIDPKNVPEVRPLDGKWDVEVTINEEAITAYAEGYEYYLPTTFDYKSYHMVHDIDFRHGALNATYNFDGIKKSGEEVNRLMDYEVNWEFGDDVDGYLNAKYTTNFLYGKKLDKPIDAIVIDVKEVKGEYIHELTIDKVYYNEAILPFYAHLFKNDFEGEEEKKSGWYASNETYKDSYHRLTVGFNKDGEFNKFTYAYEDEDAFTFEIANVMKEVEKGAPIYDGKTYSFFLRSEDVKNITELLNDKVFTYNPINWNKKLGTYDMAASVTLYENEKGNYNGVKYVSGIDRNNIIYVRAEDNTYAAYIKTVDGEKETNYFNFYYDLNEYVGNIHLDGTSLKDVAIENMFIEDKYMTISWNGFVDVTIEDTTDANGGIYSRKATHTNSRGNSHSVELSLWYEEETEDFQGASVNLDNVWAVKYDMPKAGAYSIVATDLTKAKAFDFISLNADNKLNNYSLLVDTREMGKVKMFGAEEFDMPVDYRELYFLTDEETAVVNCGYKDEKHNYVANYYFAGEDEETFSFVDATFYVNTLDGKALDKELVAASFSAKEAVDEETGDRTFTHNVYVNKDVHNYDMVAFAGHFFLGIEYNTEDMDSYIKNGEIKTDINHKWVVTYDKDDVFRKFTYGYEEEDAFIFTVTDVMKEVEEGDPIYDGKEYKMFLRDEDVVNIIEFITEKIPLVIPWGEEIGTYDIALALTLYENANGNYNGFKFVSGQNNHNIAYARAYDGIYHVYLNATEGEKVTNYFNAYVDTNEYIGNIHIDTTSIKNNAIICPITGAASEFDWYAYYDLTVEDTTPEDGVFTRKATFVKDDGDTYYLTLTHSTEEDEEACYILTYTVQQMDGKVFDEEYTVAYLSIVEEEGTFTSEVFFDRDYYNTDMLNYVISSVYKLKYGSDELEQSKELWKLAYDEYHRVTIVFDEDGEFRKFAYGYEEEDAVVLTVEDVMKEVEDSDPVYDGKTYNLFIRDEDVLNIMEDINEANMYASIIAETKEIEWNKKLGTYDVALALTLYENENGNYNGFKLVNGIEDHYVIYARVEDNTYAAYLGALNGEKVTDYIDFMLDLNDYSGRFLIDTTSLKDVEIENPLSTKVSKIAWNKYYEVAVLNKDKENEGNFSRKVTYKDEKHNYSFALTLDNLDLEAGTFEFNGFTAVINDIYSIKYAMNIEDIYYAFDIQNVTNPKKPTSILAIKVDHEKREMSASIDTRNLGEVDLYTWKFTVKPLFYQGGLIHTADKNLYTLTYNSEKTHNFEASVEITFTEEEVWNGVKVTYDKSYQFVADITRDVFLVEINDIRDTKETMNCFRLLLDNTKDYYEFNFDTTLVKELVFEEKTWTVKDYYYSASFQYGDKDYTMTYADLTGEIKINLTYWFNEETEKFQGFKVTLDDEYALTIDVSKKGFYFNLDDIRDSEEIMKVLALEIGFESYDVYAKVDTTLVKKLKHFGKEAEIMAIYQVIDFDYTLEDEKLTLNLKADGYYIKYDLVVTYDGYGSTFKGVEAHYGDPEVESYDAVVTFSLEKGIYAYVGYTDYSKVVPAEQVFLKVVVDFEKYVGSILLDLTQEKCKAFGDWVDKTRDEFIKDLKLDETKTELVEKLVKKAETKCDSVLKDFEFKTAVVDTSVKATEMVRNFTLDFKKTHINVTGILYKDAETGDHRGFHLYSDLNTFVDVEYYRDAKEIRSHVYYVERPTDKAAVASKYIDANVDLEKWQGSITLDNLKKDLAPIKLTVIDKSVGDTITKNIVFSSNIKKLSNFNVDVSAFTNGEDIIYGLAFLDNRLSGKALDLKLYYDGNKFEAKYNEIDRAIGKADVVHKYFDAAYDLEEITGFISLDLSSITLEKCKYQFGKYYVEIKDVSEREGTYARELNVQNTYFVTLGAYFTETEDETEVGEFQGFIAKYNRESNTYAVKLFWDEEEGIESYVTRTKVHTNGKVDEYEYFYFKMDKNYCIDRLSLDLTSLGKRTYKYWCDKSFNIDFSKVKIELGYHYGVIENGYHGDAYVIFDGKKYGFDGDVTLIQEEDGTWVVKLDSVICDVIVNLTANCKVYYREDESFSAFHCAIAGEVITDATAVTERDSNVNFGFTVSRDNTGRTSKGVHYPYMDKLDEEASKKKSK